MLGLLLGFLLGWVGAMPMAGPVGVLVVRSAASGAGRHAIALATGGALGEMVWCAVAFFGSGTLIEHVPAARIAGRIVVALVLLAAGVALFVRSFHSGKAPARASDPGRRMRGFTVGLLAALFNVSLLASWGAVAAFVHGAGLVGTPASHASLVPIGVPLGIVGWSAIAIALVARMKHRLTPRAATLLVRLAGCVLVLVAIGSLLSL